MVMNTIDTAQPRSGDDQDGDLALGVQAVKQLQLSGPDVAKVHGLEEGYISHSKVFHHTHPLPESSS